MRFATLATVVSISVSIAGCGTDPVFRNDCDWATPIRPSRQDVLTRQTKEQIVALLTALRLFASGDYDRRRIDQRRYLESVIAELAAFPIRYRLVLPADEQSSPKLELILDEAKLGRSALEVCCRLRRGSPPVYVGHALLDRGILVIDPLHLDEARTATLIRRLRAELAPER